MKCNLDCSYCDTPATLPISEASHDPDAVHPPLVECLDTIDFMYEYVDLYMQYKPKWIRAVVLNLYGGESLTHPNIVEITRQLRSKHVPYQNKWSLKITCTTNAVIGRQRMQAVLPFIDEFTVSYHAESRPKQKKQVLDNLLLLKTAKKDVKCVVLMHGNDQYWAELTEVIDFCKKTEIRFLPRALDGLINSQYNQHQMKWFKKEWVNRVPINSIDKQMQITSSINESGRESIALSETGRACCGGRLLCHDADMKHPIHFTMDNNFFNWYCSVNWFFLFVKQRTGEIFTNKDCRMSFDNTVAPIGYLNDTNSLLDFTKKHLNENKIPVIRCKNNLCLCGLCAPKAQDREDFSNMMTKYVVGTRIA